MRTFNLPLLGAPLLVAVFLISHSVQAAPGLFPEGEDEYDVKGFFGDDELQHAIEEEERANLTASDADDAGEACVDAWADLSRFQHEQAACPRPKEIKEFVEQCPDDEFRDKIQEVKQQCKDPHHKKFMVRENLGAANETEFEFDPLSERPLQRKRRFVMANDWNTWTKGIVPYEGGEDAQSIQRAMRTYERWTCLRFKKHYNKDGSSVNKKDGLGHQGYLKFGDFGGCWADLGNRRSAGGQKVSCCGGVVCLHELSHALGAYHEHQNPDGKGMIRMNPDNAQADKLHNFNTDFEMKNLYSDGYDHQSMMAYDKWLFSNGKGEVISYLFQDLPYGMDWYYTLKEVSIAHKCGPTYCPDFPMECVNDGYLTLVDGKCGCNCPKGLDPATGCATPLGQAGDWTPPTAGDSSENAAVTESETVEEPATADKSTSGPEYTVLDEKATYETAVQLCAEIGATLPMPKSKAENDILDAMTNGEIYLALKDVENEGAWLWEDGTAAEWTNWLPASESPWGAEPNGGAAENYVVMVKGLVKDEFSHRWADVSPSYSANQVVCQAAEPENKRRKRAAVPEVTWPRGSYGLPQPKEGCPAGFKSGSVVETGGPKAECKDKEGACGYWFDLYGCDDNPGFMHPNCPATCGLCDTFGNFVSDSNYLAGTTNEDQAEHDFCIKTKDAAKADTDDMKAWPAGQYCLYRKGSCPASHFKWGRITFTDTPHGASANSKDGVLPEGSYTDTKTQIQFCCTNTGFPEDELVVPRSEPFALLRSKDEWRCQSVAGMHAYQGKTVVKLDKAAKFEGLTPVVEYNKERKQYEIPYCYYVPVQKAPDCGGLVELTPASPTADIAASQGPEQGCTWLVTAPEGARITFKATQFDIAGTMGSCVDTLGIRFNRLGQTPSNFCGKRMDKTISTVFNLMAIDFNTKQKGKSSFAATLGLISEENLCYAQADAGMSYAGPVARTRSFLDCIPWAQASHCPHNPFVGSDVHMSLTDNSCRNPSTEDGMRPWCYYDASGCKRDYCDVCQFEEMYDVHDDCATLKDLGLCENNPKGAAKACAKTCKDAIQTWPVEPKAASVTCGAPPAVADSDIEGGDKASFAVGDTITYKCKTSTASVEARCLSSGEWTKVAASCSPCEAGWTQKGSSCYRFYDKSITWDKAEKECKNVGANLVSPRWGWLNTWVADFAGKDSWIGLSDKKTEGTFQWYWGEKAKWTSWSGGYPDNWYDADCVALMKNGKWQDRWCDGDYFPYTCVKKTMGAGCTDVSGNCANYLMGKPNACTSVPEMEINCKHTCGKCGDRVQCSTPADPADATKVSSHGANIKNGEFTEYKCKDGYSVASGNAVRTCGLDGQLNGEPLVCQRALQYSSNTNLWDRNGPWGGQQTKGVAYTGDQDPLRIPADGKLVKWQFYSRRHGPAILQVWRKSGNSMTLVGQNEFTAPSRNDAFAHTEYFVPEDKQIDVKAGDLVGIYEVESSPVFTYIKKNGSCNMHKKAIAQAELSAGKTFTFQNEDKDTCRNYKVKAVVQP